MRASIDLSPHLYWIQRIEDLAPGRAFQTAAMRGCHTLWLQEAGSSRLCLGSRSHVLRPGQVFLADPGLVMTPSRGCLVVRAALDLAHRTAIARSAAGRRVVPEGAPQPPLAEIFGAPVPPQVREPHATNLVHLLHALETVWWRSEWDRLRAALNIGHWLLDYVQAVSGDRPDPGYAPSGHNLAGRCDQLLDLLFTKHVTVGDLARRLGVSQAHLTRAYRAARGTTPAKRLAELRLRGAMGMLATTDRPVGEVAALNGFGTVRVLHAAFHRAVGVPPGRWRRAQRHRPWPRSPV